MSFSQFVQLNSSSNINKKLEVNAATPVDKTTPTSEEVDVSPLTEYDLSLRECDNRQVDLEFEIEDLKDKLVGADRLETRSYEVRSSDNPELIKLTGKPIRDIYYTGNDAQGKEHDWSSEDDTTTKQHQLDELYSAVYQSVLKAGNGDVGSLYDGYNADISAVRMIRCLTSTANVCISDVVNFSPNYDPDDSDILKATWAAIIDGPWADTTTNRSTKWHIDIATFIEQRLLPFMENNLEENQKFIVPIGVPGHSICVYFEKNTDADAVACYWVDPNGPVNPEGDDFSVTTSCVKALWKNACEKTNIVWKDHLLCNIQPQGGATLNYISGGGLCASFTSMVMLLVALNPNHTLEQIHQYLKFRVEQWTTASDELTSAKYEQKLEQIYAWAGEALKGAKIRICYVVPTDKEGDLWAPQPVNLDTFNKYCDSKTGLGVFQRHKITPNINAKILSQIGSGLSGADIGKLRKQIIKIYGDSTELNWMECHILMFMQFTDEWYEETQPFVFFKSSEGVPGLSTFTKNRESGRYRVKWNDQNRLKKNIKTKEELKLYLESGEERENYIKKCGKEDFNKKAK